MRYTKTPLNKGVPSLDKDSSIVTYIYSENPLTRSSMSRYIVQDHVSVKPLQDRNRHCCNVHTLLSRTTDNSKRIQWLRWRSHTRDITYFFQRLISVRYNRENVLLDLQHLCVHTLAWTHAYVITYVMKRDTRVFRHNFTISSMQYPLPPYRKTITSQRCNTIPLRAVCCKM